MGKRLCSKPASAASSGPARARALARARGVRTVLRGVAVDPRLHAMAEALDRPVEARPVTQEVAAQIGGGVLELGVELAVEVASVAAQGALELLAGMADGIG